MEATMANRSHPLRRLSGALGVEIAGVDLGALSDPMVEEIRRALAENGVVVFRDQRLSPEQHLAAARRFGAINVNRFFARLEGFEEIALVTKEPDQKANIGGGWHTDHSYDAAPALGSMLLAREVPAEGGDTLFASMYAAYDALSPGFQRMLAGLRATHSSRHVFGYKRDDMEGRFGNSELATQDAVHPVVITHPESGRKALYVNPGFTTGIEGWTEAEAQPLLSYLYRHAARPEFTCRLRWEAGTLAFWDNRSTWHYALNDYHGGRRIMHRITIEGGRLE